MRAKSVSKLDHIGCLGFLSLLTDILIILFAHWQDTYEGAETKRAEKALKAADKAYFKIRDGIEKIEDERKAKIAEADVESKSQHVAMLEHAAAKWRGELSTLLNQAQLAACARRDELVGTALAAHRSSFEAAEFGHRTKLAGHLAPAEAPLGLTLEVVARDDTWAGNGRMGNCIRVSSVDVDGPAAKKGISPGARLLSIDGCPLYLFEDCHQVLAKVQLTRPVTLCFALPDDAPTVGDLGAQLPIARATLGLVLDSARNLVAGVGSILRPLSARGESHPPTVPSADLPHAPSAAAPAPVTTADTDPVTTADTDAEVAVPVLTVQRPPPPMKFCTECGTRNEGLMNYCVNCGQQLTVEVGQVARTLVSLPLNASNMPIAMPVVQHRGAGDHGDPSRPSTWSGALSKREEDMLRKILMELESDMEREKGYAEASRP
jgi:hypothetical protein